jgi:hypothetical protein
VRLDVGWNLCGRKKQTLRDITGEKKTESKFLFLVETGDGNLALPDGSGVESD